MKTKSLNLYALMPGLDMLLALFAVVLVIHLFFSVRKPYTPKMQPDELTVGGLSLAREIPVFKEEIFKRKQLFNTLVKKQPGEEKSQFSLLGVSVGGKNLAMIKDNAENKDYYCSEGDKIGDFKVKQILKDKVILESEGNILVISQ